MQPGGRLAGARPWRPPGGHGEGLGPGFSGQREASGSFQAEEERRLRPILRRGCAGRRQDRDVGAQRNEDAPGCVVLEGVWPWIQA